MKFIPYNVTTKDFTTKTVLQMVTAQAPQGIKADEVRKRVRILDAIEEAGDDAPGITLEDADHEMLKRIINDFPFGGASRDLLAVIDAVNNAVAPPTALKVVGESKE